MLSAAHRLQTLRISGTPFDAGAALGRFGERAVREVLVPSAGWAGVMRWRGSDAVIAMTSLVRERFPRIWRELEGLAAGLGLPLNDVFLWHCRGDLWAMAPDGCTTVMLPGAEACRFVHNEDGDPLLAGHCALAECSIEGGVDFAAFVYPGSLPGHTFAVTDAGLAMAVDNLRCLHAGAGVPRMVLTRALLDLGSTHEAVQLLRSLPRAGGFHLCLADRHDAALLSVEFNSEACSAHRVRGPALHTNHALHPSMRDMPQIITGSSGHRRLHGARMLRHAARSDVPLDPLCILADRSHPRFPIRREDPLDDDKENTLATADIVVRAEGIEWAVYAHPGQPPTHRMRNAHPLEAPNDGS
jgi:predicted choloylglycine hydrolase